MPDEPIESQRAFWSGTITFGLVTVPVNLFPAVRGGGVHFRMLDQAGQPLRRRFFCSREDRELSGDELVHGYEIAPDDYVIVTDEELEALEPKKSREIDLRAFVDRAEIEPRFFERSYFLTPDGETNKAYRLLAEAMEQRGQAGIATFVMRGKEYLVAIIAERGILRAETLRFVDELRSPKDAGLDGLPAPDPKLVTRLAREVKKRTVRKLDPAQLTDVYAERVARLIEQKRRRGENTVEVVSEPAADEDVIDLVSILKRSLAADPPKSSRPKSTPVAKKPPARRKTRSPARRKTA